MSDAVLNAGNIHKSYGRGALRNHVLRGLDLEVARGELLAIMGPSGCGKSTLLHVLGLMTPSDEGAVLIDGAEVPREESVRMMHRRSDIGFVFQRFNLLGVLSARDNIEISLRVRGLKKRGRAQSLLEELGIGQVANRKPGRMSIGEQQRVAIARALAHEPKIVLADEPTGNLDSASSESLLECFKKINRDHGQTIVMITHDRDVASRADRIMYMADGRLSDRAKA